MFGDFLTKEECESLFIELANTKFPFVCAHGRPSIIPLIEFQNHKNNNNQSSQKKKPNLQKIVSLMKSKKATR